jgi:hypothetical protein
MAAYADDSFPSQQSQESNSQISNERYEPPSSAGFRDRIVHFTWWACHNIRTQQDSILTLSVGHGLPVPCPQAL